MRELIDKEQILKIIGIHFEYEFNEDVTEYRAVKSGNIR